MPPRLVHYSKRNGHPPTNDINSRIPESPRFGMVSSSDHMLDDFTNIFRPYDTRYISPIISIVICTYGRPESLNDTLTSLSHQTFRNYEIILLSEKGSLCQIRQRGLSLSKGDYVSFIDDDVYCPPTWLQAVIQTFKEKGCLGVTGPTTITKEYQSNRDCLRWKKLRKLQEWIFKVSPNPGTLSICGTPSMASNFQGCEYEGKVQYLECCNMSVKRKEAIDVGGFDTSYLKTSEWSEPDLSLRIGKLGDLYFIPEARLYHRPSQQGIYKNRLSTSHRWHNFVKFQRKWIKPSLSRQLYWGFVWIYLKMKDWQMI